MRADRARHAENNKSLTERRQERRLGLTRSHRLIVRLAKNTSPANELQAAGSGARLRIVSVGTVSRSAFSPTEWKLRRVDSLQRNNCGGLRKKSRVHTRRETGQNEKQRQFSCKYYSYGLLLMWDVSLSKLFAAGHIKTKQNIHFKNNNFSFCEAEIWLIHSSYSFEGVGWDRWFCWNYFKLWYRAGK